jgi:hypothetical protein
MRQRKKIKQANRNKTIKQKKNIVKLNLKVTVRFLWRSSNMYVVQTRPNLITGEQIVLHHYARHHRGKNTNINRK